MFAATWQPPQRYIPPVLPYNISLGTFPSHIVEIAIPSPPEPSPLLQLPPVPTPTETNTHIKNCVDAVEYIPNEIPYWEAIGRHGLMWPRTFSITHSAAPLLTAYATHSCPVDCGADWPRERILLALKHGIHKSVRSKTVIGTVLKEAKEEVAQGYVKIIR